MKYTVLILAVLFSTLFANQTQIYVKGLTIPTYGVADADRNPRFFQGRVYQGAQGRIYPYPMWDVLTNEKYDHQYEAVYLENEFIQVCVLPEIGGRIFSAVDKTNDYDFFYRQHVIKPSLIGMLGKWISGGNEWNFPHHHRANTFMPMDYTIEEHEDGSKTLWLTEVERRHRMKFLLGLTIRPNSSLLEAKFKFINKTPFVHSFLYFANPSVHVDSTYQVIFPPETEYVTQHAKREFAAWPIANNRYGGMNYENVDISWWKNLPNPVSFFAWNHRSDYFAGYDHGKDAGTCYIGNRHIAPGKKFFTFGCGEQGKMWDKMLTDEDGPYLELMSGVYSDNQPDYSWIQPYEVKEFSQYWFPIRDLGGMVYANENGAMNFFEQNGIMHLKLNATLVVDSAVVCLSTQNDTFFTQAVSLRPDTPVALAIELGEKNMQDVTICISDSALVLMQYQLKAKPGEPMPKPVIPPGEPKDYKTIEELYFAGLRLDEFHNAQIDPYPYYFEALARDSLDYRTNTQIGILYLKRGMFVEAEKHLTRAVQRATYNYTRPKDGEALYYLGVAQKFQQKYDVAFENFYAASWSYAWAGASYFALAEIDCIQGDYNSAEKHLQKSLLYNAHNSSALNLLTTVYRYLGNYQQAEHVNAYVLDFDPLDYTAKSEQMFIGVPDAEIDIFTADKQLVLESAVSYANAGFYNEALEVLNRLNPQDNSGAKNPMTNYWLGFLWDKVNPEMAFYFYDRAAQLPTDYCFPYRLESIQVLHAAMIANPSDAHALLYLGNLLYDHQPDKAIAMWSKSVEIRDDNWLAHRNLGYAYGRKGQNDKAIAEYDKAIELEKDARLFYELDLLLETVNRSPQERLALMQAHEATIHDRDDALVRYCALLTLNAEYDKAINILDKRHFNKWEGGGAVHGIFVDAHTLRGLEFLAAENYENALADFQKALEYPRNLEVGKPVHDTKSTRALYFAALAAEAAQQSTISVELLTQAAQAQRHISEFSFFQAMALQKLHQNDKAEKLLHEMLARAKSQLDKTFEIDFFAKFSGDARHEIRQAKIYYNIGLAELGLQNNKAAKEAFVQAKTLDPHNAWYDINLYK